MKVAIDTGPLTSGDSVRGVGFYTKHLIAALKELQSKTFTLDLLSTDEVYAKASHYDVVHIPYFNPYFLTVPSLSTPLVVTIHDTIPLLYPENYPAGIKGTLKLLKQKKALNTVAAVITDTESSKKDIVRFLGVPSDKITPTLLAAAPHFKKLKNATLLTKVKNKYNLPAKFILYVGDVNYNKNIATLLHAAKEAKLPVVIAGKQAAQIEEYASDLTHLHGPRDWFRFLFGRTHPEMAHYKDMLTLFKSSDSLRLGFVPDDELVALYNLATLYCQPSYAEGFGLPVLEALASGVPVVVSKTQALVEVVGDAALQADPRKPEEFAQHFIRIVKSPSVRNDLIQRGFKRNKQFNWNTTAQKTLAVYRRVSK